MSKSLPREQKLTIETVTGGEIEITIKKLPMGKVIDLLSAVQQLPQEVTQMDKMSESEIMGNIAQIIAVTLPKFVDVVVKAIDDPKATREFLLEECGADSVVEIVYCVLAVNNVMGIINTIKKVQALTSPKPVATPTIG